MNYNTCIHYVYIYANHDNAPIISSTYLPRPFIRLTDPVWEWKSRMKFFPVWVFCIFFHVILPNPTKQTADLWERLTAWCLLENKQKAANGLSHPDYWRSIAWVLGFNSDHNNKGELTKHEKLFQFSCQSCRLVNCLGTLISTLFW